MTMSEKPGRIDQHVKELIALACALDSVEWELLTHRPLGTPPAGLHTLLCARTGGIRDWVCTCGAELIFENKLKWRRIWIEHEISKIEKGGSAHELWEIVAQNWFMHTDFREDWILQANGRPYRLPLPAKRAKKGLPPKKRPRTTFINDGDSSDDDEYET